MLGPKGANRARKDWIKKGQELRSIRARLRRPGIGRPQAGYQTPEGSSRGAEKRRIRRWCVYGNGESKRGAAPKGEVGKTQPKVSQAMAVDCSRK